MKAVNVLHVIDHLERGGAQLQMVDYLQLIGGNGKYRSIICSLRGPTELGGEAQARGIETICLNRGCWSPQQVYDLARLIRRYEIRVVHTHLLASNIIGRLAAVMARAPFIVLHDHSGTVTPPKVPYLLRMLYRLVDGMLLPYTDRVIAVSQSVADYRVKRCGVASQKVALIHNGVSLSRFDPQLTDRAGIRRQLGIAPSDAVVGMAARLVGYKGQQCLLEAAADISRRYPHTRFLLVGGGPDRQRLEGIVGRLDIGGHVTFTGPRKDMPALLAAMDIFVLPSFHEPFGNVVLEAMAMTRPVIVSSAGGLPEIVHTGHNGIVVPPRDPLALAGAIGELLADEAERQRLGLNGRRYVEQSFAMENVARNIEALYDELLSVGDTGTTGRPEVGAV